MSDERSIPGRCFTKRYSSLSINLESTVELSSTIWTAAWGQFKAVWDTGANITMITPEVIKKLALKTSAMQSISTPTAAHALCRAYNINIRLPNGVQIADLRVIEGIPGGCDVLIGMDIISHGDFAVSNYNNQTAFTFRIPSQEIIDFCDPTTTNNGIKNA